ncbi:MAG TPA: cyclic nucleotide-binding domain-containing protein [Thermoleophilaceae bacterium]|nr:cyclic nucleotide-binding domain-containing protein [Thermoleophilaceae bacterium]
MNAAKLDEAPLFASLPDDTKRELAEYVTESEVPSGKHLVDQGDHSYNLFVILDGRAEVYKNGKSIAELGPGDFFGEMGTVGDAPRSATVISQKKMRLLTLGSRDVQRLKDTAPQVLEQLEKAIEARSG